MKKGHKMSDDHKEKLRQAKLGPKNPRFGKPGTRLGCKISEETRKKIKETRTGMKMPSTSGKNHWAYGKVYSEAERLEKSLKSRGPLGNNWQGGKTELNLSIRNSFEYSQWRTSIFNRDNFTCQTCKKVGGKLNVDHIKAFTQILRESNITSKDEALMCTELWDIDNGRTLCKPCHIKTDTYGWKSKRVIT